jgi:hypothetical protein
MALQFGETLRNNRLNQFESTIGSTPKLRIMAGTRPGTCADADVGALLCEMTLPSDWMTTAAGAVKNKNGTWTGIADAGAGAGTNATHFRLKNSAGSTTHVQGNVTATGGGGMMELDDISIVAGQPVTVTTFTITEGNP